MNAPESVGFGEEPLAANPADITEVVEIGKAPAPPSRFRQCVKAGAALAAVGIAAWTCAEHSGGGEPATRSTDKPSQNMPHIRIGHNGQELHFTPMGAYLVSANPLFSSPTEPVRVEFSRLSCEAGQVYGDVELVASLPLAPTTERNEALPFNSLTIACMLNPFNRQLNTAWITIGQDSVYPYRVTDATLGPELPS